MKFDGADFCIVRFCLNVEWCFKSVDSDQYCFLLQFSGLMKFITST